MLGVEDQGRDGGGNLGIEIDPGFFALCAAVKSSQLRR